MNKALLAGISTYPAVRIPGAANDVYDMQQFLLGNCNFKSSEIKILTNAQACKQAVLEGLAWLLAGLDAGDRVLFQFSGHGVQLPAGRNNLEPHGMDVAICPFDFDWSGKNTIGNKQFRQLFSNIPAGVSFVWISDCCHAGDLLYAGGTPSCGAAHQRAVNDGHINKTAEVCGGPVGAANPLNLVLLAGCSAYQLADDINVDGKANGAFTYFLLKELSGEAGLTRPLQEVMNRVHQKLLQFRYSQVPQIEGSEALKSKAFLAV